MHTKGAEVKIKYRLSVFTRAGWRSVTVVATASQVSPGIAVVDNVELINGEAPAYCMSRTGAHRQEFNGFTVSSGQVGTKKRISACEVLE